MSSIYVHTLGDSTLDNLYWILEKNNSIDLAKQKSIEGQLEAKLNENSSLENSSLKYQVISHAYDGFTTSSVLEGDQVGRVLSEGSRNQKNNYFQGKGNSVTASPLTELIAAINKNPKSPHYVIISVGGNDFRERLSSPLEMLKEIPHVHQRYLQILDKVQELKEKNVRPILMFQYQLDFQKDVYGIYKTFKKVGRICFAIHFLTLLGIGSAVAAMAAKKIPFLNGSIMVSLCSAVFYLAHRVIPLKVSTSVFMGRELSLSLLGALMEAFYSPILEKAKKDHIPILDLPNTFNPFVSRLYISQIEPSEEGGKLIAEGIAYIIKNHDFGSLKSVMYSKRGSDQEFTATENPGSSGWSVAYPVKTHRG